MKIKIMILTMLMFITTGCAKDNNIFLEGTIVGTGEKFQIITGGAKSKNETPPNDEAFMYAGSYVEEKATKDDLVNKDANKSKIKAKNYAFTYTTFSVMGGSAIERFRVLVKDQKVVSALCLCSVYESLKSSYEIEKNNELIEPLINTSNIKLATSVIFGTYPARLVKYDKNGFPINSYSDSGFLNDNISSGYAMLSFSGYEEVDSDYELEPKIEKIKDLDRHYKKWIKEDKKYIGKYKTTSYGSYSKFLKYVKYHREQGKELDWIGNSKQVISSVDNIFAFLKEEFISSKCNYWVAYHHKYSYPIEITKYCKGDKIYKTISIDIEVEGKKDE